MSGADATRDQLHGLVTESIREVTGWRADWTTVELAERVVDVVLAANPPTSAPRVHIDDPDEGFRRAMQAGDRAREAAPRCSICGHEWRRHDPEDGMCDAPGRDGQVCQCGRDTGDWWRAYNAERSREHLAAGLGVLDQDTPR